VSGLVAMVYEVGWFRLLSLTMGPSVYAFSAMLAMYLTGVGLGSAIGARWVSRTKVSGIASMAALEALLAAVGLASLWLVNRLPHLNFDWTQWSIRTLGPGAFPLAQLGASALVVLAPCLIMGFLFPVAVRALREAGRGSFPESTVGRLYVLNTAGGILGSLAAGFWLLPTIGVWTALQAAGAASAAIAAGAALLVRTEPRNRRLAFAGGVALLAALLVALSPDWNVLLFNQGIYREAYTGKPLPSARLAAQRLLFHREGINTSVAVMKLSAGVSLAVSGKPDASTYAGDIDTQHLLGHLPILLSGSAPRVAVIGYGSGMTVRSVLAHPDVERCDVLEIEKGVIEASPWFECINQNPLADPRSRLILEDGRTHLTYAPDVYDVIISEPSNPWMAGVSNLFTSDFYAIARSRLAPDGVFAQWVQGYEISEEVVRVILASLREHFPHLAVFRVTQGDSIILASGRPLSIPWDTLRKRWEIPSVRESFRRIDLLDPLQLAFFLQVPEREVEAFLGASPLRNTDDNVWLEHRMPEVMVAVGETSGPVGLRLVGLGATSRLRALQGMFPGIPLEGAARAMVLAPFLPEPLITPQAVLSDPWAGTRNALIAGTRDELRAMGREDLADAAVGWEREGQAYLDNRVSASSELQPIAQEQSTASRGAIERIHAKAPDLPLSLLVLGHAYEMEGDFAAAEVYYRRTLERPASEIYYDALVGMARLALLRNDRESALDWCEKAIARNPYHANAFYIAASIASMMNDFVRTRSILERGLRFNPGHPMLEELRKPLGGPS
jgi:spermidine synthase